MNRINRRIARKEAMMNTIERINTAMHKIDFTDPDSKATFSKLFRDKDYLAQQIAEASYTQYSMKSDLREVEYIFSNMDECYCPTWIKYDIEQLAASRRRWSIRASKQVWLG